MRGVLSEQTYIKNSAIVITILHDKNGHAVQLTDFAPRFKSFGRMFRPAQIVRQIRALSGTPRITVRFRPAYAYGERIATPLRGTNHSYDGFAYFEYTIAIVCIA
jgi:hypothetical protein